MSPVSAPSTTRTFSPGASAAWGTDEFTTPAGAARPVGSQPMKLRATEMPTATPAPVVPPNASAAATAPTVASMSDWLMACTSTRPTRLAPSPMALWSRVALVRDRMMLVAAAAPPATPMPVLLPPEIAAAAANTWASIAEFEVACTLTLPPAV